MLFSCPPVAYTLLKIIGASYLVYLGLGYFGIRFVRGKNQEEFEGNERTQEILAVLDTRKIFVQSVIIEASNPKTALFFWHYYHSLLWQKQDQQRHCFYYLV